VVQPGSLDPVRISDSASALIARQVFSPLASFNQRTNRLTDGAASWQVQDGGTRFTFTLKEEIKFHNGRTVTAGDVVFSLNRLAAKATGSDLSFLLENVVGFDQVNKLGTVGELEGIRQIDESNIEVRTSTPWVEFPFVLTHPATAPIPKDEYLADPEGFKTKPIGSGPYAYSETVAQGGNVRLSALEGSDGKRPAIEKASFLVYPSVSGAFRDFERRAIDIAEVPAGGSRSLTGFRNSAGFVPLAAMLHLAFNLRSPKLVEPRLREAISLAIDRPTFRQIVYSDTLVPGVGLVPAGLPGRSAEPCGNRCDLNLTRARELVSEAYAGQSPEIMYDFPEGDRDNAAAEAIRENLSTIGVTVTLRSHELPAYVELLRSGAQEMFRLGWIAEFPTTDWFVSPLFRTGSPDNTTGFSIAEVDGLIDRARSEADQTTRDSLYRQIETRVMADMPVIPLGQFQSHYAARGIEGFYVDSLGTFELNQMNAN
jgi:oligopeptide transport system substrate-binding protein